MFPEILTVTPWGVIAIFFLYLTRRMNKLETRMDAAEERSNHLGVLLERVCTGYEAVRRELLKVARIARQGKQISDDHMAEIEATPNIQKLLEGLGIKF